MEKFQKLQELVRLAEKDAQSFYDKHNKAAGTRLRGALQELKGLAQEIRNEVTEIKGKGK